MFYKCNTLLKLLNNVCIENRKKKNMALCHNQSIACISDKMPLLISLPCNYELNLHRTFQCHAALINSLQSHR